MTAIEHVVSAKTAAGPHRERGKGVAAHIAVLLTPAGLLLGTIAICAAATLRMSFGIKNDEWGSWTTANYTGAMDPIYLRIFANTVVLAAASAVLAAALAFPVALVLARTSSAALRRVVLTCVMLPTLVSLLVQGYGWILILGPNGILNSLIRTISGAGQATTLLFSNTGVLLGLVQTSLPLAVLPTVGALEKIPIDIEEAAGVLGASRASVYRHIILPLAWPGLFTGMLLVFAFNIGAFAVPLLIGGLKVTTAALIIRDQMGVLLNWPLGSALSVLLMGITFAVLLLRRLLVPSFGRRA
jgi:putative spermidine/putrescine transport system permease protein